MSKQNDYMNEKGESSEQMIQLNEIYYNCSECSSPIEILSINEEDNTIEFKCINKNHRNNISIKEYINEMKEYNDKKNNNDTCIINNHNKQYECYCLDCNKHLCKECLKSRNHISHNKYNIIEIQPNKNEINIIENIIKYYENKIDNLEREKLIKTKELSDKLKDCKNRLDKSKGLKIKENNDDLELEIKENKNKMEKEIEMKNDQYKLEIQNIRNQYNNDIKLIKYKYLQNTNEIKKKYKIKNEYVNIIYKNERK